MFTNYTCYVTEICNCKMTLFCGVGITYGVNVIRSGLSKNVLIICSVCVCVCVCVYVCVFVLSWKMILYGFGLLAHYSLCNGMYLSLQ